MSLHVSSFLDNFAQEEDEETKYMNPPQSSLVSDTVAKFRISDKTTYVAEDPLDVNINDDSFIRLSEHWFCFRASLTSASNEAAFPVRIDAMFRDWKLSTGSGEELENLQDYDIFSQIMHDTKPLDMISNDSILYGVGPVLRTDVDGTDNPSTELGHAQGGVATSAKNNIGTDSIRDRSGSTGASGIALRYCIKIQGSGVMNNDLLYPLSHVGLRIQANLNTLKRMSTVQNGSANVATALALTDPFLLVPSVKLSAKKIEEFNKQYQSDGVPMHYVSYDRAHFTLTAGSEFNLRISDNRGSVRSSLAALIPRANLTDDTVESQQRTSGGVQNYTYSKGGEPAYKVICGENGSGTGGSDDDKDLEKGKLAYLEFLKAVGNDGSSPMGMDEDSWYGGLANNVGGDKFCLAKRWDRSADNRSISGVKSKNSPLELNIEFKADASTPANLDVYVYNIHDRVVQFGSIGDVVEK